jgi:hypothetical protein
LFVKHVRAERPEVKKKKKKKKKKDATVVKLTVLGWGIVKFLEKKKKKKED